MYTYTAFCQQADGRGTIWIGDVKAESSDAAQQVGRDLCAADWGCEPDDVHCLGIAEGEVVIHFWEDINE